MKPKSSKVTLVADFDSWEGRETLNRVGWVLREVLGVEVTWGQAYKVLNRLAEGPDPEKPWLPPNANIEAPTCDGLVPPDGMVEAAYSVLMGDGIHELPIDESDVRRALVAAARWEAPGE